MAGLASSTSFQAQAVHFRFSPNSEHIAASHRSATKSADARRGAAHGGELRQGAGAAASVTTKLTITKFVADDREGSKVVVTHSELRGVQAATRVFLLPQGQEFLGSPLVSSP